MNENQTVIDVPIPHGRCECARIFLPLRAPFCFITQFKPVELTQRWDDFLFTHPNESSDVFDLKLGYYIYQRASDGTVAIAGYHVDTSD